MASLPHSKTVTYEEWLGMPDVQASAVLTEGPLKPREFPNVQIDIARIWPD